MTITIRQLSHGCKVEDETQSIAMRLDAAGRWSTFRIDNAFYRRCLDGRIVRGNKAERVSDSKASAIYEQAWQWLRSLNSDHILIQKAGGYSPKAYQSMAQQYFHAYPEPVSILPPDRYGDLVIQPAKGCPNRRCTFCAFYQDKPYSALNKEQLEQHFTALEQLFAEELYGRQGVFLGSANAMALSQRRLVQCLELVNNKLGKLKRGIATFADPDFSAVRTKDDWQQLRELGLRHIVIGLETGWGELREKLGKSGDLDKTATMIIAAKEAGINVGLTLLTGIAEKSEQAQNRFATDRFLRQLPLAANDLIYLSPFSDNGLVDPMAIREQESWLTLLSGSLKARAINYQMQRSHYYA